METKGWSESDGMKNKRAMRRTVRAAVNPGGLGGGNVRKMLRLRRSNTALKMGLMHSIKHCLL